MFEWKTPFGYLLAFIFQGGGNMCIAWTYAQFTSFAFGSCWLFIFMAKDITRDLDAFNADVKKSKGKQAELMGRFCDGIQMFSDAKQ